MRLYSGDAVHGALEAFWVLFVPEPGQLRGMVRLLTWVYVTDVSQALVVPEPAVELTEMVPSTSPRSSFEGMDATSSCFSISR